MNKDEIAALEPKYTGNKRHLTEGEAAAIVNDPANDVDESDALGDDASDLLPFAAAAAARGNMTRP